jgi:hypothetical protein
MKEEKDIKSQSGIEDFSFSVKLDSYIIDLKSKCPTTHTVLKKLSSDVCKGIPNHFMPEKLLHNIGITSNLNITLSNGSSLNSKKLLNGMNLNQNFKIISDKPLNIEDFRTNNMFATICFNEQIHTDEYFADGLKSIDEVLCLGNLP